MWLIGWLAACDPAVVPTSDMEQARVREPIAESDAVGPLWIREGIVLAGGARLLQVGDELALEEDGRRTLLTTGKLLGTPTLSADGRRAVFTHEVDDGERAVLVLLEATTTGWSTRTLLEGRDPPDRAGISPDGAAVAFVWAGPEGGVAGVWVMPTDGGAPPRRLTNGGARRPGSPPEGFIPLPVGAAPRWEGRGVVWRSEVGTHEVRP